MFIISTDNKLYYRGENKNGRGCLGHSNRVLEFEEVDTTDSEGNKINVSDIVDFIENTTSSAFLLKDGTVYYTYNSTKRFVKVEIENVKQICSTGSDWFLLNKESEIYKITSGATTTTKITTTYDNKPIKKIKKMGYSNISYNTVAYGLVYYIDENNDLYTYGYDFVNATSRSSYFCFCLKDVSFASGIYYGSSKSIFAITNDGTICAGGTITGVGQELTSVVNIKDALSFKTTNTNTMLKDVDIVDIIHISYNDIFLVYKDKGTLKYSLCGKSSVSGEAIDSTNKFYEVIQNENNLNFERFTKEIMIDTTYPLMYMWEKETNDLYMGGIDYSASTTTTVSLSKVELPEGRKAKRLANSQLYHNYTNIVVPTYDFIVTTSMFPNGAFSQTDSGFKVWDGEKYDRALFVDELEEFYELDVTKAKIPTKINTSNGEKILATTNMILYPKPIQDSNDNELALVGKAIVGKSKI